VIKLDARITVVWGGTIRTGRVDALPANDSPDAIFGVLLDPGTWMTPRTGDEHVKWIRGTYTLASSEAQALLVAEALT
jgi:hypothetical protein